MSKKLFALNNAGLTLVDAMVGVGVSALIMVSFGGMMKYSQKASRETRAVSEVEMMTDRVEQTLLREPSCSKNFAGQQIIDWTAAWNPGDVNSGITINKPRLVSSSIDSFDGTSTNAQRRGSIVNAGQFVYIFKMTLKVLNISPNADGSRMVHAELVIDFRTNLQRAELKFDDIEFKKLMPKLYAMGLEQMMPQAHGFGSFYYDPNYIPEDAGDVANVNYGGRRNYVHGARYSRKLGMVFDIDGLGVIKRCRTNESETKEEICDMQNMNYVEDDQANGGVGRCESRQRKVVQYFIAPVNNPDEVRCPDGWTYNYSAEGVIVTSSPGLPDNVSGINYSEWYGWNGFPGIADPVIADYDDGRPTTADTKTPPWAFNGLPTNQPNGGLEGYGLRILYNNKLNQMTNYLQWAPRLRLRIGCYQMQ